MMTRSTSIRSVMFDNAIGKAFALLQAGISCSVHTVLSLQLTIDLMETMKSDAN